MEEQILVTGGAGFIGSNFVLNWLAKERGGIINLDVLSYAGNVRNLDEVKDDKRHTFVRGDINDAALLDELFASKRPKAVVHFAAESHVDRSILGPGEFVRTNINGTFTLLCAARKYWEALSEGERREFRFLAISTDEVYGSLGPKDPAFTEETKYSPNSPYSASKAASDHLVRAYHHTYGLPVVTTNCSNNYGPFQFPEKLIPLAIVNALEGKKIPVYGDGKNVRDWLYVEDHCDAIGLVLKNGRPGETYNVGGGSEMENIELVRTLCATIDELKPDAKIGKRESLIEFVADRPGHDRRYAIDFTKIERQLGWTPKETFVSGIRKTVKWYLEHQAWVKEVQSGAYREWMNLNYETRNKR